VKDAMQQVSFESFRGSASETYERHFVPAIGGPLAADLVALAALRPGDRVVDIACGTGVVRRSCAERAAASRECLLSHCSLRLRVFHRPAGSEFRTRSSAAAAALPSPFWTDAR
jgi:hypothetical protein